MDVNQQAIAAMRAVTVSREYGSGGGEIATRLAQKLGWQLIDHQVIVQAAQKLRLNEADVEKRDEEYVETTRSRIWDRILPPSEEILTYQDTIHRIIRGAADTGHVVIVGRGGQVLLADMRDVLHLRVVAPLEMRVAYVARREGLDMDAARARVQAKDRARLHYMQTQYHYQHEDPHLYDLVLNTAVLDLDSAVNLICQALEYKASRLSVPVEELGPAAGMAPYPGQPADFRVPRQSSG